jgi:hypothetical protein
MHPSVFRFYFNHVEIWRLNIQITSFFQFSNFYFTFCQNLASKMKAEPHPVFFWGAWGFCKFSQPGNEEGMIKGSGGKKRAQVASHNMRGKKTVNSPYLDNRFQQHIAKI